MDYCNNFAENDLSKKQTIQLAQPFIHPYAKYYCKISNGIKTNTACYKKVMFATMPRDVTLLTTFTNVDEVFFIHGPIERLANNLILNFNLQFYSNINDIEPIKNYIAFY